MTITCSDEPHKTKEITENVWWKNGFSSTKETHAKKALFLVLVLELHRLLK